MNAEDVHYAQFHRVPQLLNMLYMFPYIPNNIKHIADRCRYKKNVKFPLFFIQLIFCPIYFLFG